jgi:hypothetical protein
MKKKPQSENLLSLNPLDVFIEMRRQGKRQIYFAKKFRVSGAAISYALSGRSNPLLNRIAKDLGMIQ